MGKMKWPGLGVQKVLWSPPTQVCMASNLLLLSFLNISGWPASFNTRIFNIH